ncbi:hypothetical protein [Pseudomonas amygdali]|uniref:hypothetical protein n=1 Tax=Pseudomonas amygdali TaxID=47877 RepID=UPI000710F3AB|nr:hypothetical protein [Pseudomonas amygdali]
MLTDFHLDKSVFDAAVLTDESFSTVHDIIIDYWKRYGVLVIQSDTANEYLESIKSLPPKFHQRWIQAFTDYSKFKSAGSWNECSSFSSFEKVRSLSQFFKVALMEDTFSAIICDNKKIIRYCTESSFELIGLGAITESVHFRKSKDSSTKDIALRADIYDIWLEKFERLTKYNSKIFISDRFVFSSILRDLDKGYKTSIAKFIELLPIEKKFNITILSDGDELSSQMHTEVSNYFSKYIMNVATTCAKNIKYKTSIHEIR